MSIFDLESDTLGQAGSADIPYTSKEGRSISKEYERLYLFDESPEIEDRAFRCRTPKRKFIFFFN